MDNVGIAVYHLPALVAGLAVGCFSQSDDPKYRNMWPGFAWLATLFVFGIIYRLCLRWLPESLFDRLSGEPCDRISQALMAPLLAVLLACFFEVTSRLRLGFLDRAFARLGGFSLEFYLVQPLAFSIRDHFRLSPFPALIAFLVLCGALGSILHIAAVRLLEICRKLSPRLFIN